MWALTMALVAMKERVRIITRRTRGRSIEQVAKDLRSYLVGWKASRKHGHHPKRNFWARPPCHPDRRRSGCPPTTEPAHARCANGSVHRVGSRLGCPHSMRSSKGSVTGPTLSATTRRSQCGFRIKTPPFRVGICGGLRLKECFRRKRDGPPPRKSPRPRWAAPSAIVRRRAGRLWCAADLVAPLGNEHPPTTRRGKERWSHTQTAVGTQT